MVESWRALGYEDSWRSLEQFSFGDSPRLAQELAELVLAGKKRATCWAASEGPKTHVGQRWVVLDGSGVPIAVIETVELTQRRFDEVDAAFVYEEGEADCTLASWRRAHQNYFGRQGTFAPDMLLYCERFRLVARLDPSDSLDLTPNGVRPAIGAELGAGAVDRREVPKGEG